MKRFYRREWLNEKEGVGSVEVDIDIESDQDFMSGGSINIRDCSRGVTLDFNMHNAESRNNALSKIATLIAVLEQAQGAILHAVRYREQADMEYEKKQRDLLKAKLEQQTAGTVIVPYSAPVWTTPAAGQSVSYAVRTTQGTVMCSDFITDNDPGDENPEPDNAR
jgi:hypothetical protein